MHPTHTDMRTHQKPIKSLDDAPLHMQCKIHQSTPLRSTHVLELGRVLGLLDAAEGEDEQLGRVLLQPLHVRVQGLHLWFVEGLDVSANGLCWRR